MLRDPGLLDPRFLARLERLVRLARRAPPPRPRRRRRFLARGRGVEVASYREYTAGDDVRSLDWAAYARLERLYVRLVEDVVEPRLELLLDASGSMGPGEPSPFGQATRALASIAAVSLARGVTVRAWAVADGVLASSPPLRGPGRLVGLLRFLARLEPRGRTALERGATQIAKSTRSRGGAVLVSDFLAPEDAAAALGRLRKQGFECLAVEVGPRDEAEPVASRAAERAGRLSSSTPRPESSAPCLSPPRRSSWRPARERGGPSRARGDWRRAGSRALERRGIARSRRSRSGS